MRAAADWSAAVRAAWLGAALAACALPAAPHDDPPEQRVNRAAAGWPAEPFVLTDQRGQPFTQEQLQRHWTFVVFGDTHCGAACADALGALDGLFRRIAGTEVLESTQVVFVSLDTRRDGARQLRDYLAPYDARFVGATGAPPVLAQLVDDLSVSRDGASAVVGAARARETGIVLVGPDGSVRAEYLPPFEIKRLTADFLKTRLRR